MSGAKRCPKCHGEMVGGSAETLYDAFGCTRPNSKKLNKQHGARIQPYYCGNCGYVEFYRED